MQISPVSLFSHRYLRLLLFAVALVACLLIIRSAAIFGFSRALSTYALVSGNVAAGEKAAEVTPRDADAHFAKAAVLSVAGNPEQSVPELERAVALRPADHRLWEQLGFLRDQLGDTNGALAAFDQAVRRAPFYANPRWDRGNVLLRSGQYEAAFNDLSQAAQSNPEFIPSLLDLAWGVSRGDVKLTEELARIDSDKMRIAFARFLARRGEGKEAVAQFARAGEVPETIKRELVDLLLTKGAFNEAFIIWQAIPGSEGESARASIYDGGFEGSLAFAEGGFGWRVPRDLQATSISLDSVQPHSGARDLRIDFDGNSNPGSQLVSQLVIVEPSKRYKINFAGRSQAIVTGGLPLVVASEAAGGKQRLGQSAPLTQGTSDWQSFSFEFTTTPATKAVVVSVQRDCSSAPCPIFGSISLDSFSVEEMK